MTVKAPEHVYRGHRTMEQSHKQSATAVNKSINWIDIKKNNQINGLQWKYQAVLARNDSLTLI